MPSGIYKRTPIIRRGDKYGRLTAIKFIARNKWTQALWLFKCECGNQKIACVNNVKARLVQSCGCLHKEVARRLGSKIIHGMSYTREHKTWCSIKGRCLNKNSPDYKDYGERGIKVCDRWLNSFENFYQDMGTKPEKKSIDRINNDGDYERSNCKWSTPKEQANNKRNNKLNKS